MKLKLFEKGLHMCTCDPTCGVYIIIKDDMQVDCNNGSSFAWQLWKSNAVVVQSGKLWTAGEQVPSYFNHAWYWRAYAKRLA